MLGGKGSIVPLWKILLFVLESVSCTEKCCKRRYCPWACIHAPTWIQSAFKGIWTLLLSYWYSSVPLRTVQGPAEITRNTVLSLGRQISGKVDPERSDSLKRQMSYWGKCEGGETQSFKKQKGAKKPVGRTWREKKTLIAWEEEVLLLILSQFNKLLLLYLTSFLCGSAKAAITMFQNHSI